MRSELHVGSARAARGEKAQGYLTVAWLPDSSPVEVPVAIVNGTQPGSCLWIQGGSHGNEYVGPQAIQEFFHQTSPEQVHGTLVLLPVINILAFRAGERGAPQDGLDMNRIWPGKPLQGAMHIYAHSEIVVHELSRLILELAHAVVDCHSGGSPHLMAPYAQFFVSDDAKVTEASRYMAASTGLPLVWEAVQKDYIQKAPGSISTFLNGVGHPSITLEVGGQGRVPASDRAIMLGALRGIAGALGILPGHNAPAVEQRMIGKGNWLRASRGGLLAPMARPLQQVASGSPLARIVDLFGDTVEEIVSPADGIVLGHRTRGIVSSGEYVCNVGEIHEKGKAADETGSH
jgi:predicted deacylase